MDKAQSELIRMMVLRSKFNRQRAVASFPLCVFDMAKKLYRLLEYQEFGHDSPELQEIIDELELRIRQEYKNCFGVELGGFDVSDKD